MFDPTFLRLERSSRESSDAPLFQGRDRLAPTNRRNDRQFEPRDVFKGRRVLFALDDCRRRRECELLPYNLAVTARSERADDEFLRPRLRVFFKDNSDCPESNWDLEHQTDRLRSRRSRPPASASLRQKGTLNGIVVVLGRQFDRNAIVEIEPFGIRYRRGCRGTNALIHSFLVFPYSNWCTTIRRIVHCTSTSSVRF